MMATLQFVELPLVELVFFNQTAKLRVGGHQVLLDLLLLHHHRAPPVMITKF